MIGLHSVLTEDFFCFASKGKWYQVPIDINLLLNASDIAELARQYERKYIWLLPTCSISKKLTDTPLIFTPDFIKHPFINNLGEEWKLDHATKPGDMIYQISLKYFWESDRNSTYINLPNRLIDWYFADITQASTLYGAISYLEELLEIELKSKPNTTGINLIERLNSTNDIRKKYIKDLKSDLSIWHENKPFDLAWVRPISKKEQQYKHIYVYDKNQQYLSASNIFFGVGEPERLINPGFDKTIVGLWKISLSGESHWNGQSLPHPLGNSREPYLSEGWFDTALVQLALDLGYQVTIYEAEVFKQKAKILEPFYKLLTSALTELKNNPENKFKNEVARQKAILGVKSVFRSTIGLFDANIYSKRKWSFRPDWRWSIIATARARMFYNIDKLLKQGFHPLAARTDALYFASNQEIPLGEKYKLEAKYPLKKVAHLFDLPIRDFIRAMDQLKQNN
ncbi:MAG: hypothetical protein WAQ98_05710 [Blastocatellia bacterium]